MIPISLIQHHQLSPIQQLDKGTSFFSVTRAVSQTNPTTTSDGAKSLPATLVFLSSLLVVVIDSLTIYDLRIEFSFLWNSISNSWNQI